MKTILFFDEYIASIIFSFLYIKEAINLCLSNKEYYIQFIIFCYKYSFVSLELIKEDFKFLNNTEINNKSFSMFTSFLQYNKQKIDLNLFEKMKYAQCYKNISSIDKIKMYIPKKLKYISFGKNFNALWNNNILPDTVEVIYFHHKCKFNRSLNSCNLPKNLKKIFFGSYYNKPINNLPDSLEIIYFCKSSKFNQNIKKLPINIKELYLGYIFNKPLTILKNANLNILQFSINSKFNNIINFPNTIKKINFGRYFNQEINELFTNTKIESIYFTRLSKFDKIIYAKNKQYTLCTLTLGDAYNKELNLLNFLCLSTLKFYKKSLFNSILILPKNIKILHLGKNFQQNINIPQNTKLIKFSNHSKFDKELIIFDNTEINIGSKSKKFKVVKKI